MLCKVGVSEAKQLYIAIRKTSIVPFFFLNNYFMVKNFYFTSRLYVRAVQFKSIIYNSNGFKLLHRAKL